MFISKQDLQRLLSLPPKVQIITIHRQKYFCENPKDWEKDWDTGMDLTVKLGHIRRVKQNGPFLFLVSLMSYILKISTVIKNSAADV